MRVSDVMTANPTCCSPETTVREAAELMADNDCGCLPVVDDARHVVGVVTDRDITCRCVAQGKDPETPVAEVMTSQASCCGADDDVDEVARIMSDSKIRRVPVVDAGGCCVGMVAQADLARTDQQQAGNVVGEVSEQTQSSSRA